MRSRRHSTLRVALVAGAAVAMLIVLPTDVRTQGQSPAAPRSSSVFRSITNFVSVDVVVRDRNGNVVKGLKKEDFLVSEEGKAQQVLSFDFEEVSTDALPSTTPATPVLGLEQLQNAATRMVPTPTSKSVPSAAPEVVNATT